MNPFPNSPTQVQLQQSLKCLAANIYHEARGEPLAGKKAVAYVTINRAQSGLFSNTICGVVFEKGQFSWTKDKRKHKQRIPDEYYNLAYKALTSPYKFKALYFHSTKIQPNWKRKRYTKIGNHIFYLWWRLTYFWT